MNYNDQMTMPVGLLKQALNAPTYGRHQISRPMRIVAPIFLFPLASKKGLITFLKKFARKKQNKKKIPIYATLPDDHYHHHPPTWPIRSSSLNVCIYVFYIYIYVPLTCNSPRGGKEVPEEQSRRSKDSVSPVCGIFELKIDLFRDGFPQSHNKLPNSAVG